MLLLSNIFEDNHFPFFEVQFREIPQLVRPEVDFDSFEFVPDDHSDDFLLLLLISNFFDSIVGLFLNILDDPNNIDHFIFNIVVFVLPVVVLLRVIFSDLRLIQKMESIIPVSEFDV